MRSGAAAWRCTCPRGLDRDEGTYTLWNLNVKSDVILASNEAQYTLVTTSEGEVRGVSDYDS